ncbi:hypothetical protein CBR_g3796 [Chara braunii]|uniref:Uncharacterized protein n=1 Tax=Chara braunii TaxID=69332 RepID=A0A388KGF8_CHABU|nr:hypothetical protein CBR_g3796 [Chara braunii]|eukprot:GBG69098.1 hypothetical protein CBR_g3796 [Chara braunii]
MASAAKRSPAVQRGGMLSPTLAAYRNSGHWQEERIGREEGGEAALTRAQPEAAALRSKAQTGMDKAVGTDTFERRVFPPKEMLIEGKRHGSEDWHCLFKGWDVQSGEQILELFAIRSLWQSPSPSPSLSPSSQQTRDDVAEDSRFLHMNTIFGANSELQRVDGPFEIKFDDEGKELIHSYFPQNKLYVLPGRILLAGSYPLDSTRSQTTEVGGKVGVFEKEAALRVLGKDWRGGKEEGGGEKTKKGERESREEESASPPSAAAAASSTSGSSPSMAPPASDPPFVRQGLEVAIPRRDSRIGIVLQYINGKWTKVLFGRETKRHTRTEYVNPRVGSGLEEVEEEEEEEGERKEKEEGEEGSGHSQGEEREKAAREGKQNACSPWTCQDTETISIAEVGELPAYLREKAREELSLEPGFVLTRRTSYGLRTSQEATRGRNADDRNQHGGESMTDSPLGGRSMIEEPIKQERGGEGGGGGGGEGGGWRVVRLPDNVSVYSPVSYSLTETKPFDIVIEWALPEGTTSSAGLSSREVMSLTLSIGGNLKSQKFRVAYHLVPPS